MAHVLLAHSVVPFADEACGVESSKKDYWIPGHDCKVVKNHPDWRFRTREDCAEWCIEDSYGRRPAVCEWTIGRECYMAWGGHNCVPEKTEDWLEDYYEAWAIC